MSNWTVTTKAELDALPDRSLIRDGIWGDQYKSSGDWFIPDADYGYNVPTLPVEVLWTPEI